MKLNERNIVSKEIDDYVKWLKEQNEEVEKLPQYIDIPFKISDAKSKLDEIETKVINIFMKPKTEDSIEKKEEIQHNSQENES